MMNIEQPKNQKAQIVTANLPGPKSSALRKKEDQYLAPGLQNYALMAGIVVDSARGCTITDIDGNVFLDIIGGIGVNGLGHSHPKFVQAIQKQVAKASVSSFTSEVRTQLFERIAKHAPHPELSRVQLYSSGAEAVESALRLAKSFTKNFEFVSFWGGFHGKTLGALSLMGSEFKKEFGPMVSGSHIVPYANCYRCPFNQKYPSCGMTCVEVAKKQIKLSSTGKIAAIIIEPVQGTAGNIIPPKEFLPAMKEIAKEIGALLIVDEMITGFGRTGTFWGSEHSGVKPDIVTLGKQFGGGYPVSAVLSTTEITSAEPWSAPSGSSSSYGGNPLASAAAEAAVRIIDEEGLVENSKNMGQYFLQQLKPMEEKYPFIGEVRGLGLLLGIELVTDKKTKEPLPKNVTRWIFDECFKRGLLTMGYASSFRIQPPLTIDAGTIDHVVEILTEVFDQLERSKMWNGGNR